MMGFVVAVGVLGGWLLIITALVMQVRGMLQGMAEQRDPSAGWRCANCDGRPDEEERHRIRRDLAMHPSPPPVAWYCAECAPCLYRLCTSGLAWDVVDVFAAIDGEGRAARP